MTFAIEQVGIRVLPDYQQILRLVQRAQATGERSPDWNGFQKTLYKYMQTDSYLSVGKKKTKGKKKEVSSVSAWPWKTVPIYSNIIGHKSGKRNVVYSPPTPA